MAQAEFSKETKIDTSLDSVIIALLLEDIPGGRTLNVDGISETVLKAGRIIIKEDSSGELKPLEISGDNYVALPSGHSYVGVLVSSILTAKPLASIMVRGRANVAAMAEAGLPSVPSGAIEALTLINFTQD